jgi:TRAP-type mannitol/chloroaromatic compound transport system permease large subunit
LDPGQITLIVVLVFLILLLLKMPIGYALATCGFIGLFLSGGWRTAASSISLLPYSAVAKYVLSSVIMFILMGSFAYHIGLSSDAFFAAQKWVGHLPGGLAIATMAGGAGFAAVSGASVASAAAFGKIAVPEMRKYGYDPGIACSSVVAAGTLSPLIPPSIMLIVYGIWTEQDVGKLLIGGALTHDNPLGKAQAPASTCIPCL